MPDPLASTDTWHVIPGWPATSRRRWTADLKLPSGWIVGCGVLVVLAGYAIIAPLFNTADPRMADLALEHTAPSARQWFGTDLMGRNLFTRSAQGLRISLLLAAASAITSTVLGSLLGVVSGATGGWVDKVVMRLIDAINAVPHLLLAVVIASLWRGRWWAIVISIALTHWTQVARIVRSEILAVRTGDHVAAAVASGSTRRQTWITHLLPAVVPQAAIAVVLLLPHAVWHEASLSFLGVGLSPTEPSLGTLLADARAGILLGAWWLLVFPGGLLIAACLAIGSLGARIRQIAAPRQATESEVSQ